MIGVGEPTEAPKTGAAKEPHLEESRGVGNAFNRGARQIDIHKRARRGWRQRQRRIFVGDDLGVIAGAGAFQDERALIRRRLVMQSRYGGEADAIALWGLHVQERQRRVVHQIIAAFRFPDEGVDALMPQAQLHHRARRRRFGVSLACNQRRASGQQCRMAHHPPEAL